MDLVILSLNTMPTVAGTHPAVALLILGATGVGALLPDADSQTSLVGHWTRGFLTKWVQHRGILHSWIGWGVFTLILVLLTLIFKPYSADLWAIVAGLSIGYFLHLLEDSWSRAGVRWCQPWTPKDELQAANYGSLLRPVVRYGRTRAGTTVPVRHWWGRGYRVGGPFETQLVRGTNFLASVAGCHLLYINVPLIHNFCQLIFRLQ